MIHGPFCVVTEPHMAIETLRKRREFLRIRGGGRWATPAFVLEGKARAALHPPEGSDKFEPDPPRFGFTVTKRMGNAVVRNRIRRRLKAALETVAKDVAKDHFDYVLIARDQAQHMNFVELVSLLETAFDRVHRPPQKRNGSRRGANKGKPAKPSSPPPETGA